jgi:cytochrome c oxidase assembly factor CtaG
MSPTLDALLGSWPFDPWLVATLVLFATIYIRGWLVVGRRDRRRSSPGPLLAFLAGLGAVFLALGSPIEPFAAWLLQVHMVQHLLLMMVAPPLVWLGAPLFPLIRGLPRPVRTGWAVPLLRARPLRRFLAGLTHPGTALPLFLASTWFWHAPWLYESALRSSALHYLQHVCFLVTGLVFWYPVVRPYPFRPTWSTWLLLPYLVVADVSNTVLSALLTFSNRPIYAYYAQVPRIGRLSALDDQAAAGVIMWVPGSVAFLVPLFVISLRVLFGERRVRKPVPDSVGRSALFVLNNPSLVQSRFDLVRLPVIGRFLRWRHTRLALQIPLVVAAMALVADGFRGPQVGALNLAGVVPWVHWRGLVVIGLLAAGNLSCMACPFLLPRTIARRWLRAQRRWPRALRSKWLAVILVAFYLWAYEAFALWDRPGWTAAIIVGYFTMAFVIDGLFRGASFCKYLCPIGQFNFVQSQVSPLEVTIHDADVCTRCRTRDCIRGRDDIAGCELGLFQPRKVGNLDCTFCLDCVHSCPHENVGILPVVPGYALVTTTGRSRSGIGRLTARPDLGALMLVLAFGGFANAAGMVEPVLDWEGQFQRWVGLRSPLPVTSLYYLAALIVLPILLHTTATTLCRRWAHLATPWPAVAARYAFALVPLGFGVWLAHLSFHLFTSYGTIIPTAQRFAEDLSWRGLGSPDWAGACCLPVPAWLIRLEITFLDLGLLLALYTAYRLSVVLAPERPLRALAPWAGLIVGLFVVGIWILFQPMQMRGTLPGAG